MASPSSEKIIALKSSDGQTFYVEANFIGSQSLLIKNLIESDVDFNGVAPLKVHANVMTQILTYCGVHAKRDPPINHQELKKWDEEFIKRNQSILSDLMMAANYLVIDSLIDLTSRTIADMIKDKSVEEIRELFRIKNDFKPEEEKQIRKENSWVFQRR